MLVPGAVCLGDGTNGHAVLLIRLGRPDGSTTTLFRGRSLYAAAEVAAGAIGDRTPDAVWITDRVYLRRHWSPWTLRSVERRLAEAAAEVDSPLVTWTGDGRECTPDGRTASAWSESAEGGAAVERNGAAAGGGWMAWNGYAGDDAES